MQLSNLLTSMSSPLYKGKLYCDFDNESLYMMFAFKNPPLTCLREKPYVSEGIAYLDVRIRMEITQKTLARLHTGTSFPPKDIVGDEGCKLSIHWGKAIS